MRVLGIAQVIERDVLDVSRLTGEQLLQQRLHQMLVELGLHAGNARVRRISLRLDLEVED